MSKKLKFSLGILILLFGALVYWAVVTAPEPPPITLTEDEPPIMTFEGNVLSSEKNGKKVWDLSAKKISINAVTKESLLEDVTGHFYGEKDLVVEVRSPNGIYAEDTKNILLKDGVILTASDGGKLTAKTLLWANDKGMLTAEGNVRMKRDDVRGSCDRLEITELFNHYKMVGKAHLDKGVKEDEKTN